MVVGISGRGGGGPDGEMKGSSGCSRRVEERERGENQRLGAENGEKYKMCKQKNLQKGDKNVTSI